jgi:hypothetical protein
VRTRARRDVVAADGRRHCRGANGAGKRAHEERGATGRLTHGTDGRCKAAGSGVAESGGGGRGRASGSGCEGGGRQLRAGAERGVGDATRAGDWAEAHRRRRIAAAGGAGEEGGDDRLGFGRGKEKGRV